MNAVLRTWIALAWAMLATAATAAPSAVSVTAVGNIAALQALNVNTISYSYVPVVSYLPGGTTGGGLFYWNPNDSSVPDNVTTFVATVSPNAGRWERVIVNNTITPFDAGAHCDGKTDDTKVMQSWVAATQAKGLAGHIPSGTCLWDLTPPRGTFRFNITKNNSRFTGNAGASLVNTTTAGGSNLNYNYCFFCAQNVSGLVIEGINAQAGTLLNCSGCTNPVVTRANLNGYHASTYLHGFGIYCENTTGLKVSDSSLRNFMFHIYMGAIKGSETTTRCSATISNTTEVNDIPAGSFIATFPVGIYDYYGSDVTVTGGGCNNIYSSVDDGNPGTGMGYCIYEGDGAPLSLAVTGYNMHFDGNGKKNAIGVLVSAAQNVTLTGNTCWAAAGANLMSCAYVSPQNAAMKNVTITANVMLNFDPAATSQNAIYVTSSLAGVRPQIATNGNMVTGFQTCIRVDNPGDALNLKFANDDCTGQTLDGIMMVGNATQPILYPHLSNETVTGSARHAVNFSQYVVTPILIGNHFLDGNTSKQASDLGAAVYFGSGAYGSVITGNVIGNTPYGGGQFTWGVQNTSNASSRPFKDIIGTNTFTALTMGNGAQFGRYFGTKPSNGLFDLSKSDRIANILTGPGTPTGWDVTAVLNPALTAPASSASPTIAVTSTKGLAPGNAVLFTMTSNPYNGDYAVAAKSWADTIATVPDAQHFTLTNGIPSGNGPYAAGTAVVTVAQFSTEAAITP